MMKCHRFLVLIVLILSAVSLSAAAEEMKTFRLFSEGKTAGPAAFVLGRSEMSGRAVVVDPRILDGSAPRMGDRLIVPFAADVRIRVTVSKVRRDVNGTRAIVGAVDGRPGELFILTIAAGRAFARYESAAGDRSWTLRTDKRSGGHIVTENDRFFSDELPDGPALPAPAGHHRGIAPSAAIPDDKTIDLLIVFTPRARDYADLFLSGIDNAIAQAVAIGQDSFDVSETGLALNLVHTALVDFSELPGDSSTNLTNLLTPGDGVMDEAQQLRDDYGADVVQLFSYQDDVGGLGYLLDRTSGAPDYAYSLGRVQQIISTTSIHEIGHNMGCHHRKDQPQSPGTGIFSYSSGWRWIGSDGNRYASVMSYTDAWDGNPVSRSHYFSNPSVLYLGAATGDAAQADNARTLRETASIVAAYRPYKTGALSVIVQPRAARSLGAAWRAEESAWHGSGGVVENLRVGDRVIELKSVDGYQTPDLTDAIVLPGATTTVTARYNAIPTLLSLTPDTGSAASATFELRFGDADGGADIENCYFLVSGKSGRTKKALYLRYDAAENRFYLRNDADSSWGKGYPPGRKGKSLKNGQGSVQLSSAVFEKGKKEVRLAFTVVFTAKFSGRKTLFVNVSDQGGAGNGLVKAGSWKVIK